ncbi:hypothetical protein Trydic_g15908 [Trypoxylus dichotomus]
MAWDWFHSKTEHALLTLEMLKSKMVKMFKSGEDKITMMKKFEARRWKKCEKFPTYFHEKVLLGNRIGLVEDDLINYIIDGMDSSILQTQAEMKEFNELSHMLQVMGDIANDQRGASTAVVPPTNTSTRPRGEEGHILNRFPRPKRDRGPCFECGSMGHQKRNCSQRRGESTTTPDSTPLLVEKDAVIPPYTLSIHLNDIHTDGNKTLNIEDSLSPEDRVTVIKTLNGYYFESPRPTKPAIAFEMSVNVKSEAPFYFSPR